MLQHVCTRLHEGQWTQTGVDAKKQILDELHVAVRYTRGLPMRHYNKLICAGIACGTWNGAGEQLQVINAETDIVLQSLESDSICLGQL